MLLPFMAMVASERAQERNSLSRRLGLLELARDVIEWAHDLADRLGGDTRIERRGIELGVSEQHPAFAGAGSGSL